MPMFGTQDVDYSAAAQGKAVAPTQKDFDYATAYNNQENRSLASSIGSMVIGSGLDLVDSISSSVGLTDRQTINNGFMNSIGGAGFQGWFEENRQAAEVGSSLVGVILADYTAGKILKSGGAVMNVAKAIPFVKNIATLDKQYASALAIARATNREVAQTGAMGVDRFVGQAMTIPRLSRPGLEMTAGQAAQNFRRASLAKSVARNATTEAVMAVTLNQNSVLYSDELSHNIAWGLGGLAFGGAFDAMVSTYTLRKLANSSELRQLNRKAYDVTGYETQRLNASVITNELFKGMEGDAKDLGHLFQTSGGLTDEVTSLAIQSAENLKTRGTTQRATTLFGNREKFATATTDIAHIPLGKATTRGLRGASGTGFHLEAEGLGAPVKEALARNPTVFYGIDEIGTRLADKTVVGTHDTRTRVLKEQLEKAQKVIEDGGVWKKVKNKSGTFTDELVALKPEQESALKFTIAELGHSLSATPKIMMEPGEWAPLSHARLLDDFKPREIIIEGGLGNGNLAIFQAAPEKGMPRLGIGSDGTLYLPDGKSRLEQLDSNELLNLYAVGRKAANHFVKTKEQFVVPDKAPWFILDLAEQIAKAAGNPDAVKYAGKMNRETAKVESFAQKVDSLRRREQSRKLASLRGKSESFDEADIFKNKVMFNLPRIDSYTAGLMASSDTPIDILLYGLKSGDDVRNMTSAEILKVMNDANKITGMTNETVDSLDDLAGKSFNFMMDRDGNAIKPIIGYSRPLNPYQWTQDELFTRMAMKTMHVKQTLTGEDADFITREATAFLTSNPSFAEARKVMELADDQHRSFVPGFQNAAPQTTMGSLINSVTSRARRDVDSTVMRAASNIQEEKTRYFNTVVKEIMEKAFGDTITQLASSRNARSAMLVNQVLSHGTGWDFADELASHTLPSGETARGLVLDHKSVANQQRFKQAYGRDLAQGQTLLNPAGQPVVMDQLAETAFTEMQGVHSATLDMKNTLLRAQGMPEIAKKNWYIPPPSTKGKYLAFTFDMENKVVPGMGIIADSSEQLARKIKETETSSLWKDGYRIRTKDSVTDYMTLWDKAQMDFIAPNTTAIQPGKSNFGRTAGVQLNSNAWREGLETMRDSIVKHGDDIIETLYDDVIKSAKARANSAKVESAVGGKPAAQHSSIYDRFIQNLTGQNSLGAKDSFFGDLYGGLEKRLNGILKTEGVRSSGQILSGFNDWIRSAVPGKSPSGETFDKFAKELGHYMPFKNAAEMAESRFGSKPPKEVADITAKLSWFEAASRLRWFESMHAVINIGSILANTPAVIRSLQPRVGETIAEAGARNSSLAMTLQLNNGKQVNLPNSMKLLWHSYRDILKNPTGLAAEGFEEFKRKATRLGYMDQEVAEFQRAWGAIDSKESWRGFMFGDKARTGNSVADRIARKGGLDTAFSVLSDKSEAMTRQWGMYAGRRVAQSMGIHDVDTQIQFAHEITNKLIANYDPRNRPEIFQGPLGAPIGLFQSYALGMYERLGRYIETGDKRALFTQLAMQSAIFGTSSLPGWDTLNESFFDRGEAKGDDAPETLYSRLGTNGGDLIMHGVLSNLPKLLGAEGASLYTRGDSSPRLPGTQWTTAEIMGSKIPLPNIPVVDTISRILKGLGEGYSAVFDTNADVGLNQLAEIASNVVTNRPLAGTIEQAFTGGADTSWDGQLVAETKNLSDMAYRVIGIRSMSQQKSIDQFYAQKTAQEEQDSRRDVLNTAARAAIRGGREDQLPQLFKDYVEQGGDPRKWNRFVKDNFDAATKTRSERALEKALKDKTNRSQAAIGRLMDGQVGVREGEMDIEDYGQEAARNKIIDDGWETSPSPTGDPLGQTEQPDLLIP